MLLREQLREREKYIINCFTKYILNFGQRIQYIDDLTKQLN